MEIERQLNNAENTLSTIAAIPVVGTLAGAVKVVMGGAQTIGGGIVALISLIPGWDPSKSSLRGKSLAHVKHGLGNIAGGTLEAIPLVGTGMYCVRRVKEWSSELGSGSKGAYVRTFHEKKWMPYPSLVKKDIFFKGEHVPALTVHSYNDNLRKWEADNPHDTPSVKKIIEIANNAITKNW